MQLIYINVAVFVLMLLIRFVFYILDDVGTYFLFERSLMIPANPKLLFTKPWTIITHLFLHYGRYGGAEHLLINMLWLHLGGSAFMNFHDSKRLLSTYFLGGFTGATVMILAMNLIPRFSPIAQFTFATGASAATLAIIVAAATTAPNFSMRLFIIGNVKLKYLALVAVLLDILLLPEGNEGGRFGHLGGALFGFIYASQLKRGTDLTVDFLKPIFWLRDHLPSRRKKKIKVVHRRAKTDAEFNAEKQTTQEQVDAILDKIKRSGYDSLSQREKEILFKAKDNL